MRQVRIADRHADRESFSVPILRHLRRLHLRNVFRGVGLAPKVETDRFFRFGVEGVASGPGYAASAQGHGAEAYDSLEGGELREEGAFVEYLRRWRR